MSTESSPQPSRGGSSFLSLAGLMFLFAVVTFGLVALLTNIFEKKQEARVPFVRLEEVNEVMTDPKPWGVNWPDQYDTYLLTVDSEESEYGGSEGLAASKLESHPWLKRLYAGYAFSLDYREARGHAYMLSDQEVTKRVTERKQGGACLHCHASVAPTYRRLGLLEQGETEITSEDLAHDFNWPAVMEGFKKMSTMEYADAHAELLKTPDGISDDGNAHPVSCVDCHDPQSMAIRVTRPGFVQGIAALAKSDDPVPHLPSIHRWREGKKDRDYDPNQDASRQEMRTFVCAQCHVEYYCASKETLFFPWANGLKVEQIEALFDEHKFPDGSDFVDYHHAETGAKIYKAQHPEFELWSQGIHARSGVSCADCHMPYERKGAMKVSSHWVRSPMLSVNRSCQTCHNVNEEELKQRVTAIQDRTKALMERAAVAMTDMLDTINAAKASGASPEQLAPVLELQKKGMWRLDFISSENSKGFHADQEAARILGESIDYCRQAEAAALKLMVSEMPDEENEVIELEGVTPDEKAPL
ncbi:ammonia-forming cytochrome c nitrite reductase subunit c552 [Bremerella sp. T1]|uniref:ammonia-forming cytochrome c nitrite reductase subunit c552 n=1 Tax=Bremerella sp. TYQ1 TaxID=3119568 RepID=UPI001CCEC7FA|nr:ammonia-forming cytochrome c nitrite reductase subunit c552 [Bremerella volcania]UBM36747.1 ammonia-forming cytochrome c nitrite reductase subunit c552 [Bremerella volcania]